MTIPFPPLLKTSLKILLLACLLLTSGQAEPAPPPPPAPAEPAITTTATFRWKQQEKSYLHETFGVLTSTATKRPVLPAGGSRGETFELLLTSLRDNRMECSREKSNRLKRSDHPLENGALEFLDQALGRSNSSNPVARSVQRHLSSEAGRQELLVALGVSQNRKNR